MADGLRKLKYAKGTSWHWCTHCDGVLYDGEDVYQRDGYLFCSKDCADAYGRWLEDEDD